MLQEAFLPANPDVPKQGLLWMKEPTFWVFPLNSATGSESGANPLSTGRRVVMVRTAIGVAILLVPVCAWVYVKYYRPREVISTTEWVRLMRKNDLRFDHAKTARATKSRPS
jgi:hypothetical protein